MGISRFPLRVAIRQAARLPLRPHFILFEDPEYNRRLASPSAHATQIIQVLVKDSPPLQRAITIAAERREINSISLKLQRVDIGRIPHDLTLKSLPQDMLKKLIQLSLPGMKENSEAATFTAGDTLQLVLAIQVKSGGTQEVYLSITIVAEPVVPAPEAAYALLRTQENGDQRQVECARFAWAPLPARIELINPDDLRSEIVRRRAVFQLIDTVRLTLKGSPKYGLQKIAANGLGIRLAGLAL